MSYRVVERIESGLVAALAMTATIVIAPGLWWFPLAVFLVFDLSMLGYLRSPAVGAVWYNAIHTYAWPAVLAVIALVTSAFASGLSMWLALVACAWALHVGVDRMLGYGLKLPDAFTHTHLGWIGKHRSGSQEDDADITSREENSWPGAREHAEPAGATVNTVPRGPRSAEQRVAE